VTCSAVRRLVGLAVALAGLVALGIAYAAQTWLLADPCPLCLVERWPYRAVVLLGLAAAVIGGLPARFILALAVAALFGDAAIAFVHVGVEYHWWNSPMPECSGILRKGAPLPALPAKPCDVGTYLIPHLPVSMALMNFVYAAFLGLLLLVYVSANERCPE
jgi:disulfide bond formation protein DsbB